MKSELKISESNADDIGGIEQLYKDAFPNEDLLPLVRELQGLEQGVLSLVGKYEAEIAGHICFTFCHVGDKKNKAALLGPLAVKPTLHKQGIGTALAHEGFKLLKSLKAGYVIALGDPAFYSRFGFKTEDKVRPPYPLPLEWHGAWQSIRLNNGEEPYEGILTVPEPWRRVELWTA